MSGYVEAGYTVTFLTLGTYAVSLVARERAARRRLAGASARSGVDALAVPAPAATPAGAGAPEGDHVPDGERGRS